MDSVCDAGVELIPTTVGMLLGQLLGCDLGRRASAARDQLHYNRSRSAPGGIRTPNLLIRSQMLYPLSYRRWFSCGGATGVTVLLAPAGGSRGNPRKDQPARKRRDLNPRCSCPHNTLAVCPIRPLWHASQGHPREATGSLPYPAPGPVRKTAGRLRLSPPRRRIRIGSWSSPGSAGRAPARRYTP